MRTASCASISTPITGERDGNREQRRTAGTVILNSCSCECPGLFAVKGRQSGDFEPIGRIWVHIRDHQDSRSTWVVVDRLQLAARSTYGDAPKAECSKLTGTDRLQEQHSIAKESPMADPIHDLDEKLRRLLRDA
jgi:hypothetical protein